MAFEEIEAYVSRVSSTVSYLNTLRPGLEHRVIHILQGKEFHNDEMTDELRVPAVLTQAGRDRIARWTMRGMRSRSALPVRSHGNGVHTLVNASAGVHFTIIIRTLKSEFEAALNLPEVHLIYSGHARWGRGACFGRGNAPGEEWEEGAAGRSADTGLFRMGYPYIGLPTNEIVKHGYTANLVESSTRLARNDCHPDLRPHLGRLRAKTAREIDSGIAGLVTNADPSAQFWTYRAYESGRRRPWIVIHAGWENTTSHPHEIGAFNPQCRVLCHFGCSTFKHNYRIVRRRKGWTRSGNERYAYWTTGLADGTETVYWLYHVLSYDRFNAFQSWEPSLRYATQRTNRDLARDRNIFRVI